MEGLVEISCFEVQKPIYYQLCGNIFLNSLDNVTAYNFAVGEKTTKTTIQTVDYKNCWNIGGYSIDETAKAAARLDFPNSSLKGETQVQMFALNDYTELPLADLVKLDIECYEYEALCGMDKYLEKSGFPPLIIEIFPTPPHNWFIPKKIMLLNFLDKLGYNEHQLDLGSNCFLFQNINSEHPKVSAA